MIIGTCVFRNLFYFLSVQFCGEDTWTTREYHQKTAGRDWCEDLCVGKGLNERQSQGKLALVKKEDTIMPSSNLEFSIDAFQKLALIYIQNMTPLNLH